MKKMLFRLAIAAASLGLGCIITGTPDAMATPPCSSSTAKYALCNGPEGPRTSCGGGRFISGYVTNRDWVDARCSALPPPNPDKSPDPVKPK